MTLIVSHTNLPLSDLFLIRLSVILRRTVSQPVCLGIKHPSGAYDLNFFTVRQLLVCWCWGALSDDRTGLSFTIAPHPRQRSHFRVQLPLDLWPYFTVSDSRLPFSSSPTTRRVTVEVFDPASTQDLSNSSGKLFSFYSFGRTLNQTERISVVTGILC
jgi:hypothetical protein